MAKKKEIAEEQMATVEEALGKTEQFIENNKKMISYVVLGVLALVLLIMGYSRYIKQPKELKAFNVIYSAEQYFEADSFAMALDGDGINPGFLEIIDDFGGTKSGNLANYYAGICYMHLAQDDTSDVAQEYYENAIDYLSDFSSDDELIEPMAYGAMGDAYDELGETEKAASQYEKAADASENEFTAPLFLMKAGLFYASLDDHKKALEMFTRIKNDFYTSNEGREIKKYIAKEKALLGE